MLHGQLCQAAIEQLEHVGLLPLHRVDLPCVPVLRVQQSLLQLAVLMVGAALFFTRLLALEGPILVEAGRMASRSVRHWWVAARGSR